MLEEHLAELIPVDQWEWWLWRVTWSDQSGRTMVKWCVSTENHIAGEIDRRWPSSYWISCIWEPIDQVKQPRQLWCAARHCHYPEDAWDAGDREAARLQLKETLA